MLDNRVGTLGTVISGNRFTYPRETELIREDLEQFIHKNQQFSAEYTIFYDYYLGHQEILDGIRKIKRPDNRIVVNMAKYIVETFGGYFMGVPPKITLNQDDDNERLQDWLNANSFQDKLTEISKQVDIYGRSYLFMYQDEQSQTNVTIAEPTSAFIVYDDSVAHLPLYFVRYWYDNENHLHTIVYSERSITTYDESMRIIDETINVYQALPAVEFYANEERQSIIANVKTLIDSLNKAASQKANQVEYFDNAYLKILGVQLERDENGEPILNLDGNQIIYAPDQDSTRGVVDFIQKPDGDNMQEHYLDRITDLIYQISMVANLQDAVFSGNSSGVAIQYKLLPMQNLAASKERKFTQCLRQVFATLFAIKTVITTTDAVKDLRFKFTRNMPINLADEAQTAQTLTGITSKETQLSVLSIVDDPKTEIKRMQDEQADTIKNAVNASDTLSDKQKVDKVNDDEERP